MPGFIHVFKHGISAISNHLGPLLSIKKLISRHHSQKKRWAVRSAHGYPAVIRVDNGSEFISRDLDLWAYHKGVVLDFSRPGKPTDNNYIESFNGKFRAECLNAHWFMSLDDARIKMEDWRRDYNEFRPHSAIGNKVPISLMNGSTASPPL